MLDQSTNCNIAIVEYLQGLIDGALKNSTEEQDIKQSQKIIRTKISIKPKGDIEMKNIIYRPLEKRYIGRKQINKKLITVYGKTQKECLNKLNQEIKLVKNNLIECNYKHNQFNVITYWDKWYNENKRPFIADTTREEFNILRKKITPLHNIPLNKLSKEKILDFLNSLVDNRTKEKIITQLRAMLTVAVKERKIKYNPFDTIIVKKIKRTPKPPFTFQEQKTILMHLNEIEIKPIILLYLTSGLRKNEMNFKSIENDIDENNILTARNLKARDREVR